MKTLRKILFVGFALVLSLAFGLTVASCGGKKPGKPNDNPDNYVYRISVQNETGYGFANVSVNLYDGTEKVASKTTNSAGNANFMQADVSVGVYTITLENLPNGYELLDPNLVFQTSEETNTKTVIMIHPTGVIQEEAPAGTSYKLGDVMYDFTVATVNGDNYTLSEVLKTKQLVLLNFWYVNCGPCQMEFPAMHNAASAYIDTVSVLAISTMDDKQSILAFNQQNGYNAFNMVAYGDSAGLTNRFYFQGTPCTILIDRYGVVSYYHVGSMTAMADFTTRFDKFVGDDYRPTILNEGGDNMEEEGGEVLPDGWSEPTESAKKATPALSAVANTLKGDDGFTFRWQVEGADETSEEYDKYSWPWHLTSDKKAIVPSNRNVHNSYSTLYADFEAEENTVLCFDYKLSTEASADILYVLINGVPVQQLSGNMAPNWETCYAYVFLDDLDDLDGKQELCFMFNKDGDTTVGEDLLEIKNLRFVSLDSIKDDPNVDANVFRHAATILNTDENATTQFKHYITPVYNEKDGYYHVNSVDGPILFANLMLSSPWSANSVWLIAYNDLVVEDGMNFHSAIEKFAWEAANNLKMYGYTPVTQDLQILLDITVHAVSEYQKWNGPYHENEWLETCVYYDHYGATPPMEDPMKGITFASAIEMKVGQNQIDVPFAMTPRGFKYKFIPEESGVYRVYSTAEIGTPIDPEMFFITDNSSINKPNDQLAYIYYQDKPNASSQVIDGVTYYDGNVEFTRYLKAGETYYMLFTTYCDVAGSYNVTIEFKGSSYTYLEQAATGPYSSNLNTGEEFVIGAIKYAYSNPAQGGDGYYHELKADGTLGGIIYLDCNRPTAWTGVSLFDICRDAQKYAEDKRAFYINGVDYTDAVQALCFNSTNGISKTDPLYGMCAVNQEVFNLLRTITMSAKYNGIADTWLLLCYYELTLGV